MHFVMNWQKNFANVLEKYKLKVTLEAGWSAIPSLTPTAKPNVSPIATSVSTQSEITEFRPQLQNGKDLANPCVSGRIKCNRF